ncbi:MAG: heme exporter protein CcmB, partial [Pseudomonadota bacterium]
MLKKEFKLEWRQKFAINGLLLYLGGVLMVIYIAFIKADSQLWVTLYWIVMLFTAINAVAKSFMLENKNRYLYYYSLSHPVAIIFSKIIYNTLLMLLLGFLCWGFYTLILGNPVHQVLWFIISIILGSISISFLLTMMSAIASKANNNSTLMAILSFPVLIPVMLLLIKITLLSLDINMNDFPLQDVLMLSLLDIVLLVLQSTRFAKQ